MAWKSTNASSSSSWVVEMEKLLEETNQSVEMSPLKMHSIYRVPEYIKNMTNRDAYRPQVVSLGPFHHGDPDLLPMEEHKRRAVLQLVKRAGKPLRDFVAAIEEVADELQYAYEGLDDKWRGQDRDSFVQMMVMDGCFLLQFMRAYYTPNDDPVFSYDGYFILWPIIQSDMVVIENQLPLLVLQKLVAVKEGPSQSAARINNMVARFLDRALHPLDILALHPLDILHKSFCGLQQEREGSGVWEDNMPSAAELSEAGIHFKLSKTHFINDIDFENGVLSMPLFKAYDITKKILLNLLAFERLHPGTGYQVLSYIFFMDNMINTESDVALLRSKGLIENLLSSDKELAKLVNSLGIGSVMGPSSKLNDVQRMVNVHCRKRRYRWRASLVHTYFRNPWVFISLLAAVILLVATLLQTVYTVVPFYTKS